MMSERVQVIPNIYQGYYQDGKRDIVAQANERYSQNLSPWQELFYQQAIDRKTYLGDSKQMRMFAGNQYQNQKFNFNPAMSVGNMVAGRQRQYRKATQIVPVQGSSDKTASQATKVLQIAYENDKTYNTISNCYKEGAVISGLALMHSWIDYRYDPICGDLRTECYTADMVMMDAFWRELDLSDCQDIRTRKYLHKEQICRLLPERQNDIMMLSNQGYYDTKFTFMPQQYNIRRKGFLAYDEYWYLTDRMGTFIVDPETYESTEVDFSKEETEHLKQNFPQIVIVKERVPTVHLAILVNDVCMYDGPNPLSIDRYPFTPFVGYRDLANNNFAYRYQGVMRNIRDQNYLYSYRVHLEMDLLAAQFSGVNVEEDALIDDTDAFKSGPGKVRFFKKNRLPAIQDIPGANINPANFQVTERLKMGVQSDAGVTPELLGTAEDSDVGITEKLRQGAALTTLQEINDLCDLSQSYAGLLHWEMIQKNYTYGKIKRMLQEEPTNEFRDKSFQKYDSAVTEAPLTATTRQLAFVQKYTLWKDGFPISPEMLLEDLSIQDKDKMIAQIQAQQQQQQQQQQQMAELQMENQRIVNESLQSKAMSDRALANEREQKGQLEQMEIVTKYNESERMKATTMLEEAKTAHEIQTMGVDNFVKIIELIQNIQTGNDQEVNKEVANA